MLSQENLEEQIKEIKGIIDRLDFGWDMGFIQQDEHIKRLEERNAD